MSAAKSDVVSGADTLPDRLVLFDGVCAVCDAGVQWILDHDPEQRFSFAPLQGPTAAAILARHPELPANLDSIVLVRQLEGGESVTTHSSAILDIAAELPSPWSALAVFRWVPRLIRDPLYRGFAAVRYRVFGKLDSCRIPSEAQVALFLD